MTYFDVVKERAGGSPEGAATFMIEVFVLGFNLAVECMETGEMAPDVEVLKRYFAWFLGKDSEEAGESPEDPEAMVETARTQMASIREAMNSGKGMTGETDEKG